jgi:hypothetical protein
MEGNLVLSCTEPPQQLLVGQFAHALVFHDPADQLQDRAGYCLGHHARPDQEKPSSTYSSWRVGEVPDYFDATVRSARGSVRGHRGRESPEGECPSAGMDCEKADLKPKWGEWELN